ncbi:g-patch domain [Moniliophthora roreri MCA 2997]|uniref:G-patch domain n=2 Tax=Moniliophthora roreri TaxID=221103 RepID=V2XE00_MONRO|nr:g-patch domain [Moniliophthora roreri MCA 2997]
MSDEEDDYLSDKFLIESTTTKPSGPKTYSQLRKDAQKLSQTKNEQNRQKSRRERELEAREEGLSKSLFHRAQEEEASGTSNKALSIMMKMGFKPGESLGKADEDNEKEEDKEKDEANNHSVASEKTLDALNADDQEKTETRISGHRKEPLPLNEWSGRQGIGTSRKLKRGPSPTSAERVAKMAKMEEESAKDDFRNRTRREYEERRAEGRLGPAQRTCVTLDEKAGKTFNVLWLNPGNPDSFPSGLLHALATRTMLVMPSSSVRHPTDSIEARLRREMEADALSHDNGEPTSTVVEDEYSQNTLEEAAQFLRLQARDRLALVLSYLRDDYAYCFWCGTQYDNQDDLLNQCPGPDEDAHD